jgi:predicted kinase
MFAGQVGIFDATNTTRARRAQVLEHCSRCPDVQVVFIESICTGECVAAMVVIIGMCVA